MRVLSCLGVGLGLPSISRPLKSGTWVFLEDMLATSPSCLHSHTVVLSAPANAALCDCSPLLPSCLPAPLRLPTCLPAHRISGLSLTTCRP